MRHIVELYGRKNTSGRPRIRRPALILTLVLLASAAGFLGANGASDLSGDIHSEDIHHEGPMELPTIEPMVSGGVGLKLVATTEFIGEVVQQVAGDRADLTVLMPSGTNPHAYSPSPRDVSLLQEADIVFVNGLDLEEALIAILESLDGPVVVPVSVGIEVLGGEDEHGEDDHDHEAGDPHFWFSPLNVIRWTENVRQVLGAADPANRDFFRVSADAYVLALEELNREVRSAVASVPASRRKLVMDHVSFGYFARDYGFEILGNIIPATSDQAEPSARQVAELVEVVKAQDIRAIFVGGTAPRGVVKLAETISAETGRSIPVVSLLTGSLAPEGQRGDNYPDFIRYNTEKIVAALR